LVCKLGKKIEDSKKILFEGEKLGDDPQNWGKRAKMRVFGVQSSPNFFTRHGYGRLEWILVDDTAARPSVYHTSLQVSGLMRKKCFTDAFWGILAENGKVHTKTGRMVTFLKTYLP